MPYIVTTKPPEPIPGSFHDAMSEAAGLLDVTRRAVATLDDATAYCRAAVIDDNEASTILLSAHMAAVEAIHANGGGTLSLPDGTVIEVASIEWSDLRSHAGFIDDDADVTEQEIVNAYNARQS